MTTKVAPPQTAHRTIKLEYPITSHGATVSEVHVRRHLTVRDLVIASGSLSDDETYYLAAANIVEMAPVDFDKIDFEDFLRIKQAINDLGDANPSDVTGYKLRRPTGREVIDIKNDFSATALVKIIAKLAGTEENSILDLNANQFSDLVSELGNFLGHHAKK